MNHQEMTLDLIGQYYSSINTSKQTGVFALSIYLREPVQVETLQQATNDLMQRLPFMNGRLKYGFFNYKYEILDTFATLQPYDNEPLFGDYYNKESRHMIRVFYGKTHFTVKTTHSICDGRALSKFTKALILRYFELLGLDIKDKAGIIDCNENPDPEEPEDATKRFMSKCPEGYQKKTTPRKNVYRIKFSKSSPQNILNKKFKADKMKEAARTYDATITEYILAHIFYVLAKKRDTAKEKGQIIGTIPIDCRSFFSSKTLRSFVGSIEVTMPEGTDFPQMLEHIKSEFKEITKYSVHQQLYEYQKSYHYARFVPRIIKALYMKIMTKWEATEISTGISNLGLIKLPEEIESHIDYMEFPIAPEQDISNFFSCVTIANTLTLTATFREEGRDFVNEVMSRLESFLE